MSSVATQGFALKKELFDRSVELFAGTADCLVTFGNPNPLRQEADIIAFTRIRTEHEPGPIGNRSRNEFVFLTVIISCYRAGDPDDVAVSNAANGYLQAIESYCRKTDPTLGGHAIWCFLDDVDSNGTANRQTLAKGRVVEIEATFRAFVRITN